MSEEEAPAPPGSPRPALRVSIVTLFPELFDVFLRTSMIGRAIKVGALAVDRVQLRDFGSGKHKSVDDTPCGGGGGMLLAVPPIVAALEHIDAEAAHRGEPAAHRVLLTPQGAPFRQPLALSLSRRPHVALVCGRYEGFDERVRSFVHEEISLGDFVMTGGEVAAMAVIEAVGRLYDGVLGNAGSATADSFSAALEGALEHPQYTRPIVFRGLAVPEVLVTGDHAKVAAWRREEARRRTLARRPDLVPADGAVPPAAPSEPLGARRDLGEEDA